MFITKKHQQLFSFTPIIIMLASSIFMLVYSVWGMMDINSMMLKAAEEQEYINKIHNNIYIGLTKRSKALFKLIKESNNQTAKEKHLSAIENQKDALKNNQRLCIHNKVKPINGLFIKQGKMLKEYAKIEERIINLVREGKIDTANSIFLDQLLKQREATLNQIITGNTYLRKTSHEKLKNIGSSIFYGISFYGLLNLILVGFSLHYSIRLFEKYISDNNALVDSTKIDLLTSLSNRQHLLEEINEQITKHPHSVFAVAFIDIDYFKSINDIYGHTLADKLLIEFAQKLSNELVNTDHCLSRFGGDEFVLLVKNTDKVKIEKLIMRISKSLNSNYYPDENKKIWLSSSIGVSLYPYDAPSIEMLLHNSDLAMYQAKQDGRACYRFFSTRLKSMIQIENEISQNLQTSLSRKENMFLVYQPLLNTKLCNVTECEALLRWNDPKLGRMSPDVFIAIAEKTNLIKAVNYFVIDEVCKQQYQWIKEGQQPIRININLAGNQDIFTSSLKRLMKNIHRMKISPALFGIEITERSLFEINKNTIDQLKFINRMGVKISIDDFGTGYSSLLYLAKLPLTTLKIDKEFIANICNKEKDNAIILSIIKLGQSLGLDIVAEGVETQNQCEYLKSHSCNVIQGYLFSKPVRAEQLRHLDVPVLENKAQAISA